MLMHWVCTLHNFWQRFTEWNANRRWRSVLSILYFVKMSEDLILIGTLLKWFKLFCAYRLVAIGDRTIDFRDLECDYIRYQYLHKTEYCNIPSTRCVCSVPLLAGCLSILHGIVVARFVCRIRLLSSVIRVIWNGNAFTLNHVTLFVCGENSIWFWITNFLRIITG
jgi:hypothetical protein